MKYKKIILWLTFTMIIAFIVAFSLAATQGFDRNGFNWTKFVSSNGKDLTANQNIDIERKSSADVQKICIEMVSEDINITFTDDSSVKAHLYGKGISSIKYELKSEKVGDVLKIYVERERGIISVMNMTNLKLDVSIPKTFSGALSASSVSAEIGVAESKLSSMVLRTVSGDIISSVACPDVTIDTTSGNADLRGLNGALNYNSVSGDLNVTYTDFTKASISGNTVSGDGVITIIKNALFNVSFNSLSGDLHNEIGVKNSSDNFINWSSTSGDLKIK